VKGRFVWPQPRLNARSRGDEAFGPRRNGALDMVVGVGKVP
jgi:hypothetical protein